MSAVCGQSHDTEWPQPDVCQSPPALPWKVVERNPQIDSQAVRQQLHFAARSPIEEAERRRRRGGLRRRRGVEIDFQRLLTIGKPDVPQGACDEAPDHKRTAERRTQLAHGLPFGYTMKTAIAARRPCAA